MGKNTALAGIARFDHRVLGFLIVVTRGKQDLCIRTVLRNPHLSPSPDLPPQL